MLWTASRERAGREPQCMMLQVKGLMHYACLCIFLTGKATRINVSYTEIMTHAEVHTIQIRPAVGARKPPVQANTHMCDTPQLIRGD